MISAAVLASCAYTTRALPASEWGRLVGTELETLAPKLDPAETQIVVVEHGERIVACWAVMRVVHVEGLWIHPDYRKKPPVAVRLLRAMHQAARAFGASWVWTGSETPDVTSLILKQGGTHVPFDSYILPIPPGTSCQQS